MGLKRFQTNIFDYDYQGLKDKNGAITQLWGEPALNQSIKLWLVSFQGDIVRAPKRSGYITNWLMKPMNDDNIDRVKMAIKDGIYQDFEPALIIDVLEVTPNYEERYWHIYLEVYSNALKTKAVVDEKIKARV